jgi:hypothetical protein
MLYFFSDKLYGPEVRPVFRVDGTSTRPGSVHVRVQPRHEPLHAEGPRGGRPQEGQRYLQPGRSTQRASE